MQRAWWCIGYTLIWCLRLSPGPLEYKQELALCLEMKELFSQGECEVAAMSQSKGTLFFLD